MASTKPKLGVRIVEIEKPFVLPPMDSGAAAAVASLAGHPGFQYLNAMLKNQGALLKAALYKTKHKDIREVDFLQSGCNWCDWLETQVAKATEMTSQRTEPREMRPSEIANFERLRSQIDVIGAPNPTDNG